MKEVCICRHFYSPTYDRKILSRTDHINLLATPKGYRWYGPGGELYLKKKAFRGKSTKNQCKGEVFPGMGRFMDNIWSVLTPDLVLSIKEILEEEFGMPPRAATQFIFEQYLKTRNCCKKQGSRGWCPTEEQLIFAKKTAGSLASKMTQFADMVTNGQWNKRTKLLRFKLLERLQKLTGVEICDETPLNMLLWKIADGLAVWLTSLPGENIEEICSNVLGEVCSEICFVCDCM